MDDQGGVISETEKSLDLNNHDQETSQSSRTLTMPVNQEVVIMVRSDEHEQTDGSFDHNDKVKRVLKENVEKKSKDEIISSCVDVKSNDEETLCRICQLSCDQLPERSKNIKELNLVELGCGCKDELGVAHFHCAQTWFKLKGNRICEICGVAARNVTGIFQEPRIVIQDPRLVEWNERRSYGRSYSMETNRGWWRGQPCCNFLMACLIVAFVLPLFFRVNIF